MNREYLLGVLDEVSRTITAANEGDEDIANVLCKLSFVRELIEKGEVRDLNTMIVYIAYTSNMNMKQEN